jgi:hypothetical protein
LGVLSGVQVILLNASATAAASPLAPIRLQAPSAPPVPPVAFLSPILPPELSCRWLHPPRLSRRPFPFRRSWLATRLYCPRWGRLPRPGSAQAAIASQFLLLDSGAGLFRNLIRDRCPWLRFFNGSRFRMAFLCHGTHSTALSSGPLTGPPPLRRQNALRSAPNWGTEMSTPRSRKIYAIRCTLSPLRCASKISSLYCLNASILGCFR